MSNNIRHPLVQNGLGRRFARTTLMVLLVFCTPAFLFATNPTLGTGTDPANASLAPGGAATFADSFTLQTTAGTDTVTAVTVTLAAGTFNGLSLVEITNNAGTIVYGSVAPASNTPAIALGTTITANTTLTQYRIRVTPKAHAAMPAPPGATYNVTAFISSWTGSGTHLGSDTGGTTVTIDNQSPGDVTATNANSGVTDVTLTWTVPADADLQSIIVLRRATTAVANAPVEATTYSVGNAIGTSIVACVVTAPTTTCSDTGLVSGTTYHYKIYTRDTNGNYSAGIIPTGTPLATKRQTILGDGVDPANVTRAPGGVATNADSFTFLTSNSNDAVTSVTVSLASGTSGSLSLVEITNNAGSTVYGSVANPASDTPVITLTTNITATTTLTQYRIRVTPKSHVNMPAPAGSTYSVTALISDYATGNVKIGSDNGGTTVTIDNLSPGNVTASTATAGNTQVSLAWTNPADADLGSIVVLRRAVLPVTSAPVEGLTYLVGNAVGSATVACVVATPAVTCTDTGLTNGISYHYAIFAKDSNGNYATGAVPTGSPATPRLTTLANGTDPANATVAPGGSATMVDSFTFAATSGTDAITAVNVTLAAGTFAGLSLVEITDNAGTVVYGSVTDPPNSTPAITLTTNIPVTTTATQYKIRVTPKTHANMPVPAGSTYSVTALISNWTGTNAHSGADTAGTTVTVDNLSPGNVTAPTATAGNGQVLLAWTNPGSADLNSVVVLRRATTAVGDTPVEGALYVAGNTIGSSTVACVVTAPPTVSCTDTGLTNATAYHYKIFTKDTNGNYATGVVPTGSPATPNATTLANGADPGNASIAPGGTAAMADSFTFQTAVGTDTITAVTVTLAAGTFGGLSLVEITNDAGTVIYGSVVNPASATPAITLTTNITATTTATQYKIRVTPRTHANMPAVPGSSYSVTALISNWTGTLGHSGSDSGGTTVTIDNLSPGNVTASTAAPGNAQAVLNWTNPADADLGSIIVLRRITTAVASTPVEGTTYAVGNVIGTSTVACVVAAPATTCTDTGLTNGSAYHYRVFARDTNGNYAVTGVVPTGSPVTPTVTTLANGVDPANANLAPGGSATLADSFTVQTASGTDTITAINVTLAAGTSAGLSLVEITNNAGTTVLGSIANPASDTPAITLTTNITATTTATQYRIRVTPKSHVNMPPPAGSSYSVTASVSNWTGTNAHAGSDTGGTTVTIDNLSPGNVTASTATAGNRQVVLAWTNPADADLGTIIVLRRPTLPVTDIPVEGITYVVGNTIGTSVVACVVATPTATCTDLNLTNGTAYHYRIFAKDTNGNYATGVIPTGSPATPFAGVTVSPTSGLVTTEAGGTATFTMVLTSQPTANVTISLTSSDLTEGTVSPASVTFTSVNWNVAQTVTITGVNDPIADGAIAYTIVTGAAVSTDPGYNGLAVSGVTVSNTDNDTAGVTVAPVSGLTTTEAGGTATFTMVLTSQPTADVTIPLSTSNPGEGAAAPASVTFTSANWNVAQTVTVTGADDAFVDGTVAYTIVTGAATSADLVYNGIAVADVSVSNTDNDTAGVVVSPTSGLVTTEAGGTATFSMALTSHPNADVTISLSSSDLTEGTVAPASVTFTPANWNLVQIVTVTGVDDVIVDGTIAYTIVTGATSSTDPTYNGLAVSDVSVSNTDNSTAGVTVTPTNGLVTTEAGGTATFTLVLTTQPTANVTIGVTSSDLTEGTVAPASVTFTSANWNVAQTVTVTGVNDAVVDGTIAYTIVTGAASSTDPAYSGLAVSDVSVSTTDNDTAGVTVTPTSGLVTTEVGGTATFTFVLTSQPVADVTIPLSSSDLTEGTVAPASLTFTAANWNVAQTATVTGVDDVAADGAVAYSILTGVAASADPVYNGLSVADVSVSNTDNDVAGVTVTPVSGLVTTEAGGTATFTIVLTSQEVGDVVVLLNSSNPAEGTVSPASVTFTSANWNVPQTITVTGVDDAVVDGTVAYTIQTSQAISADPVYSGLLVADVSVSNTDNDAAGVTVTPVSGLITTETGGPATFTVVLTSQPTADVTIPLSSSDLTEGTVAPASVTFTSANWNIAQTVTVTGVDDEVADGTLGYTIVTGAAISTDPVYSGRAVADVSVSTTDNDAAGVTVTPVSGLITTEAGGTATFTIVLTSQPTADVTIPLSSGDLTEGTVAPASVTFTSANWNVAQTVTVTGVDDAVVDGTIAYTIVTGAASSVDTVYNGMAAADVSVSTTDDDAAGVTVTPIAGLITTEAGGTDTFTVVLTSQPTANVTIALTSSDLTEGTVAPASLMFTSANWNVAQTVTVTGIDDAAVDGTVAYTIVTGAATSTDPVFNNMAVADVSVSTSDNDSASVTVTPVSGLSTTETGGAATFTVVLTSQPTADVTIPLSSDDLTEGTVAPASLTFTSVKWNIAQTVTVTGEDDAVVDGTVAYTIVTGTATSTDPVYSGMPVTDVSVSTLDNDSAGVTVTPSNGLITTETSGTATFTIVLNSQPTADVTIALSSSDLTEGTVAPASVTFTSANWNIAQTLTITGVDDLVVDGTVAYTIVTGAASSTDPVYNGEPVTDVSVSTTDNDSANVTVTPISGLITTEALGTATFTMVLTSQPTDDVTIPISSSNPAEGLVSPASVTFTPADWNIAQTVTVTGFDDLVVDGTVAYTILTGTAVSTDPVYNSMTVADVSVSNTDNDIAGVTVTPTSGLITTEAGGTATFTVELTSQPTGPVTITISSSDLTEGTVSPALLIFTTVDWNVAQTVTITGVDDAIADGTVAYSIVTGAANSADPIYNGRAVSDVAVSTTDNDSAGVTVTPISGLVTTEAGGTATFTMVLTSQPTADVTIPLSSSDLTEGTVAPASVTFTTANWNVAQTVTVTGVDDAVVDGPIAYTIVTGAAASTDPVYNNFAVADISVSTTDNDTAGVTVAPVSGLTTTEAGGTATFTIVLASQPTADVTIPISSSDVTEGIVAPASVTFTTANWNIAQTVTVTGVDDAVVDGTIAYTIVTGAASSTDPVYNNHVVADVSVSTTDNDTAGVTVTPISGLVTTEAGGTASFTVVLTSQPTADVTIPVNSSDLTEGTVSTALLTFTSVNWNVAQTVTVTGVDDAVVDGTIAYTIVTGAASSTDPVYNNHVVADVLVSTTDNDTAGVTVTPISGLVTTEAGGTATFTVVLTSQPTADVTIPVSSSDLTEGTVSTALLTFTSVNWNVAQTVTVTGVDDAVVDGTIAYTIVTGAASSTDPVYNNHVVADVSVSTTDNDTAGVTVTPISGLVTTEAAGTATFTVVLTSQPTADVTIPLSSSDATEGTVSPAALTFTSVNWNIAQTVTVTGVNDFLDDGDIAYSIVTSAATSADTNYSGFNPADVSVTTTDNDASGFTVTPTTGLVTTESGSTATFTIVLTAQPTADVTVGLTSSDITEGTVAPASVTFTSVNWNVAQTVTVTGVDDVLADGPVAYSIVTAVASSADTNYNGVNPSDVSVITTDNDTAGITVTPITGLTATEAGGTATFTMVLTTQPSADVLIGLTSSDLTEGTVAPASVTFTSANWNVAQTVTMTGVDDSLDDGDIAYSIITAAATSADTNYNGFNPSDVSVTTTDNDVSGFTVIPTTGLVTTEAGGTATFTIVLTAQPTADVTLGLSSNDITEGTVAPPSLVFTSINWNVPQTVTVTGVDDVIVDGAVAYSIVTAAAASADTNYNGVNPSDVSVTTTDNDTAGVTVTPITGLVTTEAGGTATFTIVLTTQPSADVLIGLSSSDLTEGTVAPAPVTFTSANWNVAQTVTVTGVDDAIVDGTVAYSIVTAAATSADTNYNGVNPSDVSVTTTDNDTAGVTVTPITGLVTTEAGGTATFTVVLTSQPTADVTIPFSSSDTTEGTVSPASVTFTSVNWNIAQTVTATGVDDSVVDGTIAYTIDTAAAASTDPVYNGLVVADVAVSTTDNDTAGVTVTPISGLTTTEAGGTATFTMVLTSQPVADVKIDLTSSDLTEGTVAPASVTFTSANWNIAQTVTVTGVDDLQADGTVAYTILTAPAVSTDPVYSGFAVADVSVSTTDNDVDGVTVTPITGLVTTEVGGTATFTVVLTTQPTANVTIPLSSSDTTEGTVAPSPLTFTSANWNIPQTVTVTGVDDAVVDGTVAYTIFTGAAVSADPGYNGFAVADVSVSTTDDDTAGVTVTPVSGLTTTEAGGTATFTMVLTSQPVADVTIGLSSSDPTEGTVAPASVTFTSANWNIAQTVTVTGVDDLLADGTVAYAIATGAATSTDPVYSGFVVADVSVSTTDNDTDGVTITPITGLTTTEAGGTATFTVALTSQPTAGVTIGLTSSDLTEGTVAPASLSFTAANWNVPQTVTITGVDDAVVDGTVAYTIVTGAAVSTDPGYSGLAVADVSISTTDNDVAGVTVTPVSGLVTTEAGGTATFTVVLTSQPVANVTVSLSSTNTAEGTVSPSSLTFTAANWNVSQTVTVTGIDDTVLDGNIVYSIATSAAASSDPIYNNFAVADVSVTNTDDDNLRVDLSVSITNNTGHVTSTDTTLYTITVTNNGPASVTGAVLMDPALAGLTKTSISCTGSGCPATLSIAQLEGAGIILGNLGNLETVSFDIATTITAANGSVSNTATVAVPTGIVDPDLANNTATDTDSVEPRPDLFLQVTASTQVIELGDTLSYAVRIENRSGPSFPHTIVTSRLARGLRYVPGSALLSGDYGAPYPIADPMGSPGPVLTFSIPAQYDSDGVILFYRVRVGAGAMQGTGLNIVEATTLNGTVQSNSVESGVVVSGGVFTPEACVIGKIFADGNRNHTQDKKELGIPGVHLIFEDGTILVSDVEGKYSYCGLTPATHVLKVDRTTLPAGAQLTVSSNRNGGDANSLFVDLKYGEIHRADFIEGSRDPKVLAEIVRRRSNGEVWTPSFETPRESAAKFAELPAAQTRRATNPSISPSIPPSVPPSVAGLSFDSPAVPPAPGAGTVELGSSNAPGDTGKVKISADRADAPADGSSVVNLTVQLVDADGHATTSPVVATIEVTGGRLQLPAGTTAPPGQEGIDAEPRRPGTQLRIENGVAVVQLLAPGETQDVHIRVSVEDDSAVAVSADGVVSFVPRMRRFVAVGLFEGMMAHSSSDASLDSAVPAHEAFDKDLQHFAREGDVYVGGRSAFFLKGTVLRNYLVTMSFDTDKTDRGVLFRDIQPDAFYPIYGDSSLKVFEAQTSGKFYMRAERGHSFLLYGDLQTALSPTPAQDLGLYRRTLTGLQQHLQTRNVVLNVFGSHDSLTQVIDEIAGLGISGPYSVSNTNGVSGTEKVEIVTRDRNQPSVILNTVAMTRFTDYEFEPFNGRLLFRRPVPAVDELLNPVSVRVTYEVERGGEKAWVGGIDGHINLGRFVQVGGSWAEDRTPDALYRLNSLNGILKLGALTTLTAEGAHSSGIVNTNSFNQSGLFNLENIHGDAAGNAGRLELRHESSRLAARVFAGASSREFNNPASTLTGGRSEISGNATVTVTKAIRVKGEAIRSEDKLTDGHREGAFLALEARLTKALGLEFGVRRSKESVNPAQGTSVGTPLFGPAGSSGLGFGFNSGTSTVDPDTGQNVINPGFTPQLSAGTAPPQTPEALDVLSVRAIATLKLRDNFKVYAEGEQDVRDAGKNAAAIGGQFNATERTRLYLRHEFLSSMSGPYALTDRQSSHNTVFGISSSFLKNTDAFSEYRLRDAISGREAEAALGLRNLWTVAEGVNLSTSLERLNTFAGVNRQATAASLGFEFTRSSLFKTTERIEWRRDGISESWVSTIGLARKISRDWSVLSKNYYQRTAPRTGSALVQNRFWIGGAYRQTDTNNLNVLSRYEYRYEDASVLAGGNAARREVHTVSTHADWHPLRTWNFSGQYAAKRVKDTADESVSPFLAHLMSGRIGHDVSKRIDLGLLGSTMWSPEQGGRQSALGAEIGYMIHDNMWVSVGYNWMGFSDRDLVASQQTGRGVFVRFRLKFDEDLFGRGR